MRHIHNPGSMVPVHQHVPQALQPVGVGEFQIVQTAEGPMYVPVQNGVGQVGQTPATGGGLKSILILAALAGAGIWAYKKYVKGSEWDVLGEDDPAYEPRHRARRSRTRVLAEVDKLLDSVEEGGAAEDDEEDA